MLLCLDYLDKEALSDVLIYGLRRHWYNSGAEVLPNDHSSVVLCFLMFFVCGYSLKWYLKTSEMYYRYLST